VRVHQIWALSSKRAVSATVVQSSKRTVADKHRLSAHQKSTAYELYGGTNISDLKRLEPPNRGF